MKKTVFCAGCLALGVMCLTAQAAETVYVGQSIGTIAVQGNGVNTIASVAFKELTPTNGQAVSVANIVSTENLDTGDKVGIWWEGGYESWTLAEDAEGVKFWEKNAKKFSIGADGQVTEATGADASAVRPSIGSGIWLRHEKGGTFTFHLFGAYVELASTEAAAAVEGVATKTLMGNPTLTAKTPTITGMANGDTIQFATGAGRFTVHTYNTAKGQWGSWEAKEGEKPEAKWVDAPQIPAGIGFWYVATGAENVTFAW